MVKKSEQIQKASKGVIEKFYDSSKTLIKDNKDIASGIMPSFNREDALDAIRKDSTVMAALNTLVDKSMSNGYKIVGIDGKSKEPEAQKKLEDLRLNKLLRQIFYNLYAYGNVFIENVKNGNGNVKELHVLETTHTEPIATQHGEIVGYIQHIPGVDDKNAPTWEVDEVTHVALTKLTTGIWGELDIEAVYTSVLIKQYVKAYLGWLFGTNQFKGFYNIKSATDEQIEEFVSYLKRTENDITKPLLARGEIAYQIVRDFKDGETILNLLNKCDTDILTLMQVPPIAVSIPGDSNRSNSDAQERSLSVRVAAVQEFVADAFQYDMFPKIGYPKIKLVFSPVNPVDISKMLEDVERMKNIGFKMEAIEKYLALEQFPIQGKLLDKDKFEMNTEKSMDMYDSRKGKLEGESNEKIGSGEESTTREDQLVSKGKTKMFIAFPEKEDMDKFRKYPYVME